jgi:branched-chain amino acid aminotransferase
MGTEMSIEEKLIWCDGELLPWDDATTHVLTHALHYGSGVFEGIRAYETATGPAVFRLRDHMERLHRSAGAYDMPLAWDVDRLCAAAKEVLAACGLESGYLRPLVFYELGAMGLDPTNARVRTIIAAWEWGTYLGDDGVQNGIRVKISSWRRFPQTSFPNAKATGTYINSTLAKREAVRAGYDEAIMLNHDGLVSEGSGENIFLVKDQVVITPPVSTGCLHGITRDTVMTLLSDSGYQVVEADVEPERLHEADEVLLTGTAAEVTPIREIDDRPVGDGSPGPVTRDAQRLFAETATGRLEQYQHWLDYV